MKRKKASVLILSAAMTASLILGGVLSVTASSTEGQSSAEPVIFYDFESENVSGGTVKNSGSKANSDAQLVAGDGGVSVSEGKLVFAQEKSASANESKTLGHLRLPDDMFADLQAFTFVIDVYDLTVTDNNCGFLSFLTKDPAQYGYGSGIENDGIEINYTWDPIAQGWTTAAANPTLNRSDYNLMVQTLEGTDVKSCFAPTPHSKRRLRSMPTVAGRRLLRRRKKRRTNGHLKRSAECCRSAIRSRRSRMPFPPSKPRGNSCG